MRALPKKESSCFPCHPFCVSSPRWLPSPSLSSSFPLEPVSSAHSSPSCSPGVPAPCSDSGGALAGHSSWVGPEEGADKPWPGLDFPTGSACGGAGGLPPSWPAGTGGAGGGGGRTANGTGSGCEGPAVAFRSRSCKAACFAPKSCSLEVSWSWCASLDCAGWTCSAAGCGCAAAPCSVPSTTWEAKGEATRGEKTCSWGGGPPEWT